MDRYMMMPIRNIKTMAICKHKEENSTMMIMIQKICWQDFSTDVRWKSLTNHHNDDHVASYSTTQSLSLWKIGLLSASHRITNRQGCQCCKFWSWPLLISEWKYYGKQWRQIIILLLFYQPKCLKPEDQYILKFQTHCNKLNHLYFFKFGTVPSVGEYGACALPVLQKGDRPQRHEYTEEHSSSIVKQ